MHSAKTRLKDGQCVLMVLLAPEEVESLSAGGMFSARWCHDDGEEGAVIMAPIDAELTVGPREQIEAYMSALLRHAEDEGMVPVPETADGSAR